jgi:PKD repeat protein/plastocyanin
MESVGRSFQKMDTTSSTVKTPPEWAVINLSPTDYPVTQSPCAAQTSCTVMADFTTNIVGTTVTFTSTSNNGGIGTMTYNWRVTDGVNTLTTNTNASFTYNFGASGTYNVCLYVTNTIIGVLVCRDSICKNITVRSCPDLISRFTYAIGQCKKITFTASTVGATSFKWIFWDGTTATTSSIIRSIPNCDSLYKVKLVSCNLSCCDTTFMYVSYPCCRATADFCLVDSGTSVKVIYTNETYATSTFYIDGVATAWTSNTYKVLGSGSHTICRKVVKILCAGDTCCATVCKQINVGAALSLVTLKPDFWYQVQTNGAVLFTNKSTPATGITCQWNFGDSISSTNISTALSPSHTYSAPGIYQVTLQITAISGGDSSVSTYSSNVIVPVFCRSTAKFTYKVCTSDPKKIEFTNYSTSANSYMWNFGDGSPAEATTNPVHSYPANGSYKVCLKANSFCSSSNTICTNVNISDPTKSNNCAVVPGPTGLRNENIASGNAQENNSNTNKKSVTNHSLEIFPNPANREVRISLNYETESPADITVLNSLGSMVYRTQIQMHSGKNVNAIPVEALGNGSYFIKIRTKDSEQTGIFTVRK